MTNIFIIFTIANIANMIKTFVISDELFYGFSVMLDPSLFDSIKSVIQHVKDKLKAVFTLHNLELLCRRVDELDLHIHDVKFISDIQHHEIIYICSHC